MRRRRVVRVPASSANLGPGFDVLAAALALHVEVEAVETGRFAVHTELSIARDRRNLCVRGFELLHPPDRFEFTIRSNVPLAGGLGTSAALPAGVPMADAVFNIAHASLLVLGLARGDLDLIARGLQDRLHQPRRRHLYPGSLALAERARELGALGATISGAGPSVLFWCPFEATGAVAHRLTDAVGGGAQVLRVPFEPQGADVRAL